MSIQLGLKIVKTLNGYQEVAEFNGNTSWTKNVRDTREDCKLIEGLSEDSKSSVIMYTSDNLGEYYTIVSLIDGRVTDFISAWIFRPWNLEINGKDLLKIIQDVRSEILASEINEEKLSSLFAVQYPQSPAKMSPICTEGTSYAVRYYNKKGADYSISELFELGLAQKINQKYRAIFLVDCSYNLSADACDDITSVLLEKTVTVFPPSSKTLADANGFKLYIGNEPFTSPITAIIGDKIIVSWKKENYRDINLSYPVSESGIDFKAPSPASIRRVVNRSIFDIRDESSRIITDCKISIENVILDNALDVSESVIRNAQVKISHDGFLPYTGKHDLTQRVNIKLKYQVHNYKFSTYSEREEGWINFEINTRKKLTRTPLDGYHSVNGSAPNESLDNRIEYRPSGVLAIKWACVIASILFVLGIALGAWGWSWYNDNFGYKPQPHKQGNYQFTPNNNTGHAPSAPSSLELAINYLEDNDVWKKSEMEDIQELKGLWDELNQFELEKVLSRKERLSKSKRFVRLTDKIEEYLTLTNNKKTFDGASYNLGNDDYITIDKKGAVQTYLKLLDDKIVKFKAATQTSPGSRSDASKSKGKQQQKTQSSVNNTSEQGQESSGNRFFNDSDR